MNAEIIAVGSELLLGQITNTNAQFISKQLSELGINVFYHTVVGDNPNRLQEAIALAESRADLLIFTGGLGPTKDDLTKHTIATHLNKQLVVDEPALTSIKQYFERVGKTMTPNNEQQALVLEGATILANHHGMAPGMLIKQNNHTYILLPGPPKEMQPMFRNEAFPILAAQQTDGGQITSNVLRFYGIGESELETKLLDLLEAQSNPTIAPLASDGEVSIRITAKAPSTEQSWALINEAKAAILERVGMYCYGEDDDTLQSKLVQYSAQHDITIAAAESLTAGLFMAELAEIPGASRVLEGGYVTYSNEAKIQQLGVKAQTIEQFGVVSKEVAAEMASQVRQKLGTTVGISFTGVAGPEPQNDIAAGTVWMGISMEGQETITKLLQLHGSRNTNRIRTVKYACSHLLRLLRNR
jgi:nicotinamide-nucleotide amidase